MPTVGKGKTAKKFDYDSKGEAAAEKYAAKTGLPLKKKKKKKAAAKPKMPAGMPMRMPGGMMKGM